MKSALEALLEVQGHDTRLAQLRHRLADLPERNERDRLASVSNEVVAAITAEEAVKADLGREQRRLEDEITLMTEKRTQVEAKLYDGSVTNARELQDLQEDSEAQLRRIRSLEDDQLVIMEKLEPVEARLASLGSELTEVETGLARAEESLTVVEAELAVEVDAETEARRTAEQRVEPDLLAEYERIRRHAGGVGVARLTGSQCGGCHLGLSAMEVARIRKLPPDSIVHCEECGRLLVP